MENIRKNPPTHFANIQVAKIEDYRLGNVNGLPKADVVKFILEDDSWICVRPSGTEPKCKFYIGVKKNNENESKKVLIKIKESVTQLY